MHTGTRIAALRPFGGGGGKLSRPIPWPRCRPSASFVFRRIPLFFDGAPPKPPPPPSAVRIHFAHSLSTASQPFMLKISLKSILPAVFSAHPLPLPRPIYYVVFLGALVVHPHPSSSFLSLTSLTCRLGWYVSIFDARRRLIAKAERK